MPHNTNDESLVSRWCFEPVDISEMGIEEMARRCAAHDQWMLAHPEAAVFSKAWADRNLNELMARMDPQQGRS